MADDKMVDIDEAIKRAKACLRDVYRMRTSGGQLLSSAQASRFIALSEGYLKLAKVLQAERDWEERQIDKIRKGGVDATLQRDESDEVRDPVGPQHDGIPGEGVPAE